MVGSSIIARARKHAENDGLGTNLGLEKNGVSVRWAGKGGLCWESLFEKVLKLYQEEQAPPKMLIIHCGANSIGSMSVRKLRNFMKYTISQIVELLPHTLVVWSEMLPRLSWRNMLSNITAENERIRLNSCIITFSIRRKRGACICYPDITLHQTKLFSDGVHLSKVGNSLFLNTIQGGIYSFIYSRSCIYP